MQDRTPTKRVEDIGAQTAVMLRVDPLRNNQWKGIRLAAVYEIARIDLL
jgi:hypothetical protein